jgi:hypothetical protein
VLVHVTKDFCDVATVLAGGIAVLFPDTYATYVWVVAVDCDTDAVHELPEAHTLKRVAVVASKISI